MRQKSSIHTPSLVREVWRGPRHQRWRTWVPGRGRFTMKWSSFAKIPIGQGSRTSSIEFTKILSQWYHQHLTEAWVSLSSSCARAHLRIKLSCSNPINHLRHCNRQSLWASLVRDLLLATLATTFRMSRTEAITTSHCFALSTVCLSCKAWCPKRQSCSPLHLTWRRMKNIHHCWDKTFKR